MNRPYWFILLIACTLFMHRTAKAIHTMGGDLTYVCLGNNQYQVNYNFFRYCDGILPSDTVILEARAPGCYNNILQITLTCTNYTTPVEISPLCTTATSTCNGGIFLGIQQYNYAGIITLPAACSNWQLSVSECCRNSTITTLASPPGPASYNLFIYSILNNTNGLCNNSSTFSNDPVPFACIFFNRFSFNHGAYDVDGDSLVYQLITPRTGPNPSDTVDYIAGFSAQQPVLSSPAVQLDPRTGDILMDPTNSDVSVFAILVSEYRNGVLIGQVERDMQLNVLNCNNRLPSLSSINGIPTAPTFSTTAAAGSTVSFWVGSVDPDPIDSTAITWNNGIPGATLSIYGGSNVVGGHRDSARFIWTPSVSDIGRTNCFTLCVTDDGCPYAGSAYNSYCIDVIEPIISVDAGQDDTLACGTTTTLQAVVNGPIANYSYLWNTGQTTSSINVGPGIYVVTASYGSTSTADTVQVFTLNIPQPTVNLATPQCTLTASPASQYQWLLNGNPILNATGQTYQPTTNGFYQVEITEQVNCTAVSNFVLVTCVVGIDEQDPVLMKIEPYPNPANDRLLLDLPPHTDMSIDLFTMDGRWVMTLFHGRTENTGQTIQHNIKDLPAGLYTVYLRSVEGMAAKRVAVIRP